MNVIDRVPDSINSRLSCAPRNSMSSSNDALMGGSPDVMGTRDHQTTTHLTFYFTSDNVIPSFHFLDTFPVISRIPLLFHVCSLFRVTMYVDRRTRL